MAFVFSRIGETSSLEQDGLSLKIGAHHLSDSSCNSSWARLACLGENTRFFYYSRAQQPSIRTKQCFNRFPIQ